MTSPSPIHAESLTISYVRPGREPLVIVDSWDLTVDHSEVCCVAGRSGSGKTSVLRAVAGLLTPTDGQVSWWGDPLAGLTQSRIRHLRRTRIGYVDQAASLLPELTVLENVLLPLLPDGRRAVTAARPRAQQLLERLDLSDRANHRGPGLSGGERQRATLARALVSEPAILIADEPTASLDRELANLVIDLLRNEAARGCTIVTASHDPEVAIAADSVRDLEPANHQAAAERGI